MADLNDLALLVGIDVNDNSFKEFKNKVENAMDSVSNFATSSSSKIGSAFKSAMPAVGTAVKGAAIGAAVGFTAVAGAAGVAGKQIFDMATETAAAGDRIDKMSQKLGLSREGFQEWDYILSQNGASIDSMKAGMTKLNETFDSAQAGSSSAMASFEALGYSMEDLQGKSREELFEMTVAGLQGIDDESKKAAIAQDLLGKSSVELAALLNGTAEGTEALRQNAHDMGMVLSDETVAASAALTDSLDNLQRGFAGFKNKVAADFLPGVTSITDGLGMLLKGDFEGGADKIADGLNDLITQASNGLTKAVEVLGQLLPTLLPVLAEAVINLMQTILDTITGNIDPLVSTVVDVLKMLAGFIIENLPLVISAGIEIIVALALGIANAIPDLIPVLIEALGMIITTIIDNLPLIIEAAFQIVEALAFGIIDALPTLIAQLPKIINSITDFVTNHLPELVKMGIEIIIALAGGIIQAIPQLLAQMPQLITALLGAIGGAVVGVVSIGKNIVEGLWNGIKSMGSWISDKVKGFFGGIVDSVKGLLGIHSPSKVFAEIGGYMGEGLVVGFDSEMVSVDKIVEQNLNKTIAVATDFNIPDTNIASSLAITTKTEDKKTLNNIEKQKKAQQFKDIVLQFPGNVFTDKQGLKKVAKDLKEVLDENGIRTGESKAKTVSA